MISPEGEKITFIGKTVQPKGDVLKKLFINFYLKQVEAWLFQFQDLMRESLSKMMKTGKRDYEGTNKERHEWVLDHPA